MKLMTLTEFADRIEPYLQFPNIVRDDEGYVIDVRIKTVASRCYVSWLLSGRITIEDLAYWAWREDCREYVMEEIRMRKQDRVNMVTVNP